MSEVLPGVPQPGVPEDHRSGKLQKQTDIQNDIRDDTVPCPATVATPQAPNGVSSSSSSSVQTRSNFSGYFHNADLKKTMSSSSNRKTTLSRGHALEGTSPPPDSVVSQVVLSNGEAYNGQLLMSSAPVAMAGNRNGKLNGQPHDAKELLLASHIVSSDSGHGTFDHTDESSDTSAPSRDSSVENASIRHMYKDSSNTNIPMFFKETIRRSAKDRKTVLMLEEQLLAFINCSSAQVYKTGELTSYDRMIVHRMAAYMGLEHNVDSTGRCVVLNKTENTRSVKLSELNVFEDAGFEPKKRILLKKPVSFDEKHYRGNKANFGSNRTKSLEERRQDYMEARERIFKAEENHPEGELNYNNVPYHSQQLLGDSTQANGHLPSQQGSTEPSDYQTNGVYTASTSSSSIPTFHSSPQAPAPGVNSTQHNLSAISSIIDTGPSPVMQLLPHVNQDSSLYQFDTTCPPPFIMQLTNRPPPATPPPSHIAYQNNDVSDLTTRFSAASMSTLEQGSEPLASGVLNQTVPIFVPQSVYAPVYPSQIMQGQYYVTSAAQPSLQYVTLPTGQAQQLLQGTTLDTQGQVTVPMPPLGVSAMPNNGSYQMVASPYPLSMALGQPLHSGDHNSLTYHYGLSPEAVIMAGPSGLNTSASGRPGAQQLFLAYPQPQPLSQPAQFTPAGTTPQGTYYSIPSSTPTPPLSLAQPPPVSHQQQQQQTAPAIYYTSSLGNPLTYPVSMADASSASSLKPVLTPFLQTQYVSQHPKQQQLHPHHPQPVLISPHSGQQPAPVNQAIPYSPGQPLSQVNTAQGPLLEAVQSPFQVRPLGLYHLAGNPVIQAPHLGTNPHLQSYQFFRPAGSDVRLVNPGSVRSPLQITNAGTTRPRYNGQYRHPKKWGRKPSSDFEGYQAVQAPGTSHQTAHMNIITPLAMSGSIPGTHPHIQPSTHRQ